jgi:taurine transport system permease protein
VFVDIAPDESQVDSPAAVVPSGKWRGRLTRGALPVLSLVVFFIVWQLVAASGIWNQTFVPYPSTVWHAFLDISTTHDGTRGYAGYLLWEHLYMTLRRVSAGVVIGVVLGVLPGLLMGSISWVRSVLEPWLTFLRALPPLAYFFLLVIWLGIDEAPKITLLALAALPPAAVATTAAVVAAPVGLQEAARALGAARTDVIRDGVVPSALPETFTGIRLAVGMAYSSVVAAELFNGLPGIGGLVKDAQQRVAIARALAAETPLFLLDEPFAALDALTRERLQEDVRQVSVESGRTTVFVTHSADEAALLGSRIVVLTRRPGQVALDLPVDLPRTGVDPDELRRSPEFSELRAEVGRAVRAAAA